MEVVKHLKYNHAMVHSNNDLSKLDAAFRMIGIPIEQMKLKANEIYVTPYKIGTFKMPQ